MSENDILEIQEEPLLHRNKLRVLQDSEIQFQVKKYSRGKWKILSNDEIRKIASKDLEALTFIPFGFNTPSACYGVVRK